ncbi:MAG TPA: malto-oligosyltrehalose trehalohydrolase, partial [Polyangiaceae bacterium]
MSREREAWALGARPLPRGTRFRVFAEARSCRVRLCEADGAVRSERELEALGDGFFEATLEEARHGTLYRYVLDGRELPDPYARFLPFGVHGPAMVIEPRHSWRFEPVSRALREQVLYELHVGTFTRAGTYAAAAERLPALAELGITTVELLPLAAFPGARGWGYDGVALYAPFAGYGTPDDLRAFVDAAHALGLGVVLDVVYNHLGPDGNYLGAYSSRYFTARHRTAWGDAPNFEDAPFRSYALDNARYWLEDFRFDGLRLDATHAIVDESPCHFLRELAGEVKELTPRRLLFAEDERNAPELVTDFGLDAVWADDFHHQVHVTLTGEREGYYAGYAPGAADLARTLERGWLYEGQPFPPKNEARGASAAGLSAESLLYAIQNHDQIGNRARGERLNALVSLDEYLAASLLFLCLPMTPLLFMGQEWAASTPFGYFTDHHPELGKLVSAGRLREFAAFEAFREGDAAKLVLDPQAEETFLASQLVWEERTQEPHARTLGLYHALLRLRRCDPVLRHSSR